MRTLSITASLLTAFASCAYAQEVLDCAKLSNSALAEPQDYAIQCAAAIEAAPAPLAPLLPNAPSDTGYAYNMRGVTGSAQGLYSFTLSTFGTQAFVGDPGASFYALDFDPTGTTLYAIQSVTGNPSVFGTVNTATGAFTSLAPVSGLTGTDAPTGLSIDPVTGDAFLSTATNIYSFNLGTGAATLIGSTGVASGIMIDIAINCDGDMYGHDISTDSLYSINRATGAATLIGGHGLAANFAQGMDFDNNDGTLYAAIYTGGGTYTYGSFNLTTGAISPLHTNTPSGEWELAIPTTCGPVVPPSETEPNDSKAEANTLQLPGSNRTAVMTGNSTAATGSGIDTFLAKTSAQAPGFYRHRLIVQSTTQGHTISIRGLSQSGGVINPNSDIAVQTSSTTTTPARFIQWYTSGAPADLYVRVTGTASTTDDYSLDYEVEAVTPVTGPSGIAVGEVTITTVGQTSVDTDMWIHDGARLAIPDYGNDDEPAPGSSSQSRVSETFDPGVYYAAVSTFNLANNLASPATDRYRSGSVVDFPGVTVNSSTSSSTDLDVSIGGTPVTVVRDGVFGVQFVRFVVGAYEIEGNDDKATANTLVLPPNDATSVFSGNSTSSTGTGLDYVRVTTAAQAADGFYRHRLIVTSDTPGHTLTIRGLSQSAGAANPTSDITVQASSATTTPARFIQWYTTEAPADIYVRVAGTAATTADYSLDYTIEAVVPVAGPDLTEPTVTITTIGQTTTDTDFWVYDGDRLAIPDYGNDDAIGTSVFQSNLVRAYADGTYTLAISNWQFANDQTAPIDDGYRSGSLLDFPGAIANTSTTLNAALNPSIGGTSVPLTRAGPFDVGFVTFSVSGDTIFKDGFDEAEPMP